jgi:hypothetical protein
MADATLRHLAEQTLELSHSPEHRARRQLWEGLHSLSPSRTLVSYAMYTSVWEAEIADRSEFRHQGGLARMIETQLRARLWKAQNIPDDEPVLPTVWLPMPHPGGDDRLWGVALPSVRTDPHGSYKPVPPVHALEDLARMHLPRYEQLSTEAERMRDEAVELTGGLLPVKFHTDEIHYGPFEWVVRMRGMDHLLLDVVDAPGLVHALMRFATAGVVAYHRERESAGAIDAEASWGFHMYWDRVDGPPDRLSSCWAYVHAQSAASLSPAMYAAFIQPYNAEVASLFGRVYYHGCEDLSAKCRVIKDLPNLRLFHVSPWTPVEPVVGCFGATVALEVHSHPTNVLFGWDADQTRADLMQRHRAAEGVPHVLKLCDVETVGGHPEKLALWARLAREVAETTA